MATRKLANGGAWHSKDFWERVKAGKAAKGHDPNWVNHQKANKTKLDRYGDANFNNTAKNKTTRMTNFYQ